jgi:hypothetical protein
MKKLFVLLVSAALVLSMAAVSMAAVTVNGDFRQDFYNDESRDGSKDEGYGVTDLRLRFTGDLSDSVKATVNFKWANDSDTSGDGTDGASIDEFYVLGTQSWGSWKVGHFEYKFVPSRVELKTGNYHVWKKTDSIFVVNVPVGESGFSVDGILQPFEENGVDKGAYGVSGNYVADKWGAKVSYANFLTDLADGDDNTLVAADVYYKLTDDMTVFVNAVDLASNDAKYFEADDVNTIDGVDTTVGFKWNNMAGIKNWFGSIEYSLAKRDEDTANEYDMYFFKTTYLLSNGVGLELFYCPVGDDEMKTQLRLRYQF